MNKNRSDRHKGGYKKTRRINFFRSGQIFSVVYHLSLLILLYILIEKGESDIALKVFAINAGIVLFAFTISTAERIIFNSLKRSGKHRGNNRERSTNQDQ
jgi:hypothetical protein